MSSEAGDRGFCFVRQNIDGQMFLTTYGRSTGFCIDPVEKKPLNHFYPGTSVLSFGTAGCNLGCKFCQNWDISKSREVERLSELALPRPLLRQLCELAVRALHSPTTIRLCGRSMQSIQLENAVPRGSVPLPSLLATSALKQDHGSFSTWTPPMST